MTKHLFNGEDETIFLVKWNERVTSIYEFLTTSSNLSICPNLNCQFFIRTERFLAAIVSNENDHISTQPKKTSKLHNLFNS